MDLDIVYHIDNRDDIYKHLKDWVRSHSINLAYIQMQFDNLYYMRKILYNINGLLDEAGCIAICCDVYSFSHIFQFCQSIFDTVVYWGDGLILYIFVTKKFLPIAWQKNVIDLSFFISKMTKVHDNILLIESSPKENIALTKNLGRNVIVFTDYKYNIYEGVTNVCLEDK